jgi:hypothetical protein
MKHHAAYLESDTLIREILEGEMGYYIAPRDTNWPCFDSYGRNACIVKNETGAVIAGYKGLIGFQMTIRSGHSVLEEGDRPEEEFARFLENAKGTGRPWFIFVVPDKLVGGQMFTPYVAERLYRTAKKARIFVMELDLNEPSSPLRASTDAPYGEMNADKHKRDKKPDKRYQAGE